MPPRTPLQPISGNERAKNAQLTPSQRGQIIGALQHGASFVGAATAVKCNEKTARDTLKRFTTQPTNVTKKRPGRPLTYDDRFERKLLRFVRPNPKATYAQIKSALDTYLSHDVLYRILKKHGLTNWMCKKRPFLSEAVAKKRLAFALEHKDWTYEEWATIIFSDECSVERGAGAQRTWAFRTPQQKWSKEFIDTYKKGHDISVMVWGAIWVGGRSEIFIMNRDEDAPHQGYTKYSYLEVLNDQLPTIFNPGMLFMQDNAPIHTAHLVTKWFENNAIPVIE